MLAFELYNNHHMQRVSIIGLPASGKSTLADAISKRLSISHIHIDRFWFEAGGLNLKIDSSKDAKDRVRATVKEKVKEAISDNTWVSDGFYSQIQSEIAERSDQIIFLNIPFWQTLLNHGKRMCRPITRHSELSWWHEVTFFFDMIRRFFVHRPKILKFINENRAKVVTLKNFTEVREYLEGLG